jgi:dihydroxy-acid dehydratase
MYTANTMASAIEAIGMTLPGSSSFPAESQEKHDECASIGPVMYNLLEKNILPREIMTRSAFENAMVCYFPFHASLFYPSFFLYRRFSP